MEYKMGKKICLVPGCKNASVSLNEDGNKITLHRFPIGEARKHIRKQWITVLKNVRSNLIVNDNSRICSEHFESGYTKTAIPTIFKCKPKPEVKKRRHLLRNSINLQDFEDDQLDPESNLPEN
ncbi:hypothetical protein KUTeg_019275 [Tegillarca granosa]|uniref:THAP-type domain-containing protein n=1 Tax=Tegillarca granosa TaxID=220873 RepID=A0ABQ9EE54_TEGGR|nr:hypothetical protein KUTeg_019275 [Tegillarca granosa]